MFIISYIVRILFTNVSICIILIILISVISYVLILNILREEYILNLKSMLKLKFENWRKENE